MVSVSYAGGQLDVPVCKWSIAILLILILYSYSYSYSYSHSYHTHTAAAAAANTTTTGNSQQLDVPACRLSVAARGEVLRSGRRLTQAL